MRVSSFALNLRLVVLHRTEQQILNLELESRVESRVRVRVSHVVEVEVASRTQVSRSHAG